MKISENRMCLKFCITLGKTAAQTYEKLKLPAIGNTEQNVWIQFLANYVTTTACTLHCVTFLFFGNDADTEGEEIW
jgi:hypothetical protein